MGRDFTHIMTLSIKLQIHTCASGGDIVMLRDECVSLFEKLEEGDINENVRHLKYKFESFSKSAIEQLKEKSATIDMLLEDLKELQSSLVQPQLGEVGGSMVMKDMPSSPPVEYQQLEPQTSMSMMNSLLCCVVSWYVPNTAATTQSQIKQEPVDEDVLPSDYIFTGKSPIIVVSLHVCRVYFRG